MKAIKILTVTAILLSLGACSGSDDDDCEREVAGCPSDWYSCPEAANCYSTRSGCEASGECD